MSNFDGYGNIKIIVCIKRCQNLQNDEVSHYTEEEEGEYSLHDLTTLLDSPLRVNDTNFSFMTLW